MGRKEKEELQRLENHLAAADARQVDSAKAYNRDSADVDLDKYAQRVQGRKKSGCLTWLLIFLILAALGVFLYQLLGGNGYGG